MKILVADDDATSRLITEAALRHLGHQCETVTDGAAAWDAFRSGCYDVVISDWMMPGQTGLQLPVARLRGAARCVGPLPRHPGELDQRDMAAAQTFADVATASCSARGRVTRRARLLITSATVPSTIR